MGDVRGPYAAAGRRTVLQGPGGGAVTGDPPVVAVGLLGGFVLSRDGTPLTGNWRRSSARTVVKVLALAPATGCIASG